MHFFSRKLLMNTDHPFNCNEIIMEYKSVLIFNKHFLCILIRLFHHERPLCYDCFSILPSLGSLSIRSLPCGSSTKLKQKITDTKRVLAAPLQTGGQDFFFGHNYHFKCVGPQLHNHKNTASLGVSNPHTVTLSSEQYKHFSLVRGFQLLLTGQ